MSSRLVEILERGYKTYGVTLPVQVEQTSADQVKEKLENGWQTCLDRLLTQDVYQLFEGMIKRRIDNPKLKYINNISDLKYYAELQTHGDYTQLQESKKLLGEFNLYVFIHRSDEAKSYALLESLRLHRAFIYRNTMRHQSEGDQIVNALC